MVGMGFVLAPEEAHSLIDKDPRNRDVLCPYLNGEDINSSPNQSPSRWVINFYDWPLEQAEAYAEPIAIVREKVYPVRMTVNREAHRKHWWHYGDKRPALYASIASFKHVLVLPRVSKHLIVTLAAVGVVFSDATIVIVSDQLDMFAAVQSTIHESWVRKYASTLETRLRYTPSDCFETYPFPELPASSNQHLAILGETYHEHRRQMMLARQEGLTTTYNRFHNSDERAADIARLRELHVEMDRAVPRRTAGRTSTSATASTRRRKACGSRSASRAAGGAGADAGVEPSAVRGGSRGGDARGKG